MKILVSGSHGLVGKNLLLYLNGAGHHVIRLSRKISKPSADEALWVPEKGVLEPEKIEGADVMVHLAGESLMTGRWTPKRKKEIAESRILGTQALCESLRNLARPPKALVSASAIGFYGNRGDEILDEKSAGGSGYLADVCRQWEEATLAASQNGIRTVHIRTGIVLTPSGGALAQMLPIFRFGLGGRLGSGRQYMSWIALEDLLSIIMRAVKTETVQGPLNAVAPNPVTNAEFTRVLARVLRRPAIFPAPPFALKIALGEMANELLLSSTRVLPRRLLNSGFKFRQPELEPALRYLLG